MSDLWIPQRYRQNKRPVKVVFYHNPTLDQVLVGFPEQFPAPAGFEKIICTTASEVERWSQKMRDQDRREQEMTDEQREAIEGPIRDYARKELIHLRDHARNALNRDFCQEALNRLEEQEYHARMKRESFMHQEAFEDGR
jgi:hypothetical protein